MRKTSFIVGLAFLLCFPWLTQSAPSDPKPHPSPKQHLGFYLHAGWNYNYPFAPHSWQRADFANMFHFLKELGYDTVLLWPLVETIPMPLSEADTKALRDYRHIVDEAQKARLECWLTFCPNLSVRPDVSAQPWNERTLMPNLRVMRFDNAAEKTAYLEHRAKILAILNNADGYVTIDGDPGGYAGARPEEFVQVFQADRETLRRHGTHPGSQKVIPWVWCGWGTRGVWQEPIQSFVEQEMALLKTELPEPNEFLIGQCRSPQACRRINVGLAQKLKLAPRSRMMCYESVEYEPSQPAATLQFDSTRDTLREEQSFLQQSRGAIANAQTPLMVLPGIYFFARAARDNSYLATPDREVLRDFAGFLGGDAELLVPAWSCLGLNLDQLPDTLPAQLRASKLKGKATRFIPGGAKRYLEILAAQAESRIELLHAIDKAPATTDDAAERLAKGAAALISWWKQHRYAFEHDEHHPFAWNFVTPSQVGLLQSWAARHGAGKPEVMERAAARLAKTGVLPADEAKARMKELCG